ncbi:hypothetical protein [Mycobacterium kubicae]|uniref:hypothetical protein n=1 Tax=Mycobacterium kubicae TaxID=120959 RepID=UPI000B220506|nr:hypothetical protein [Mycobacterium kubicae]
MPISRVDDGKLTIDAPELPGLQLDDLAKVVTKVATTWARLINGIEGPPYEPALVNITQAGIIVEISIKDIQKNRTIQRVSKASDDWWTAVTSWIEVFSKQDIKQLGPARQLWRSGRRLQFFPLTEAERLESLFLAIKPDVSGVIDLKHLRASFAQAGEGVLPPDEWVFLRDARSLYFAGEYRRATIDVGSATEIALVTLIRKKLALKGMRQGDIAKEIARCETKTLGGKRTFYETTLGLGRLPQGFERFVLKARNDAVHMNRTITKVDARRAIAHAEQLVKRAAPLAAFIPSS